jgi:hypothetical protein
MPSLVDAMKELLSPPRKEVSKSREEMDGWMKKRYA